ncbi:hypothetical protein OIU76_027739 [Salix suchowensis]|nr:hypothetical protein OIU76_027739 [Salix suchowensis]
MMFWFRAVLLPRKSLLARLLPWMWCGRKIPWFLKLLPFLMPGSLCRIPKSAADPMVESCSSLEAATLCRENTQATSGQSLARVTLGSWLSVKLVLCFQREIGLSWVRVRERLQKVLRVLMRVREGAIDELQNLKGFGQGGLNSPLKQHEVVNLMKKSKVDVRGFFGDETFFAQGFVSSKFRLKKWKFISNRLLRLLSSRIVVLWNPSTILLIWLISASMISATRVVTSLGVMGRFGVNWTGVLVNPHWSSLHDLAHVHFGNQGAFSDHSPFWFGLIRKFRGVKL